MAGTNQIFTIVAFALLVVLVLGLGLLVAILVQRQRTKRAKAASALRKAERLRAAELGIAGLHEDTDTSGGISLLGLSVQQAVPDAAQSAPARPSSWAAAPRQTERPAAWLPASVQQASGAQASGTRAAAQEPHAPHPHAQPARAEHPEAPRPHAPGSHAKHALVEEPHAAEPAPAPHAYGSTFSGGGTSKL